MQLVGDDPFGAEFFERYTEWQQRHGGPLATPDRPGPTAGAQQAWVPELIRSGSRTRAIGPAAGSVASNTQQCDASALTSMVKVTR